MKVIIIAHSLIPSVILCGHKQLEYLQLQNKVEYRFISTNRINSKNLSWADIIIFLRSESEMEYYAAKLAKKSGKHLIYVLDDDLLNAPLYLSSGPYYNKPKIKNNIRNIMSLCDSFLTTSPIMLEKYGNNCSNSFLINEPSLSIIDEKKENKKIRIGFAGSIDRTQDINQIIEKSLSRIIEEYSEKIEVEFMGAKPDIVDKYHLNYLPYKNSYEEYTNTILDRNWDIGLAPIPDSSFHSCKYFNKYVEYASCGIVGIYSKYPPYIFGIKDGENGLLVENDDNSWYQALKRLIEDEKLRKEISANCLSQAKELYSLEVIANDYLQKITKDYVNCDSENIPFMFKEKVLFFFHKLMDKIAEQGIRFPLWALKYLYLKITGIKEDN